MRFRRNELTLHANSTKPLTEARVHTARDPTMHPYLWRPRNRNRSSGNYGTLMAMTCFTIQVTDNDGVTSVEPYSRLALGRAGRSAASCRAARGIGTAITPDACCPLVGKIATTTLGAVWFAYQGRSGPVVERQFREQPAGAQSVTELDRFDWRASGDPPTGKPLRLTPGETFYLTLKASGSDTTYRARRTPERANSSRSMW